MRDARKLRRPYLSEDSSRKPAGPVVEVEVDELAKILDKLPPARRVPERAVGLIALGLMLALPVSSWILLALAGGGR
jgi:hypothetical protein